MSPVRARSMPHKYSTPRILIGLGKGHRVGPALRLPVYRYRDTSVEESKHESKKGYGKGSGGGIVKVW